MHNAVIACSILMIVASGCGGGGDGPTPPPTPVFTSVSVSPASPAMVEGDTVQLSATPRDQNGAAMSGLPAATFARTAGNSVSVTPEGRVIALDPGGSTVTATVTSSGTTHTGTSTPTVTGLTTAAEVAVSGAGTSFNPSTVKIASVGSVTWNFTAGTNAPHNVTFTGTGPAGGDIPNTETGSMQRTFATVGTYQYQCTRHGGMTGTVVVRTP